MNKTSVSRAACWAMALVTVVLSALLIIQCADIYFAGTSADNMTQDGVYINAVYSPEIVSARFSRVSWAAWAWLAVLLAALITRAVAGERAPETAKLSDEYKLGLIKRRVTPTREMGIEERKRRIALVICALVCAICAVKIALYFVNPSSFASRELESVMGEMLKHALPWLIIAFAALFAFAFISGKSARREIALAKTAPKREPDPPAVENGAPITAIRIVLYLAAAAFIIAGIMNGGMYDVLVKAVNICTECIGLG